MISDASDYRRYVDHTAAHDAWPQARDARVVGPTCDGGMRASAASLRHTVVRCRVLHSSPIPPPRRIRTSGSSVKSA